MTVWIELIEYGKNLKMKKLLNFAGFVVLTNVILDN
jgi:hypothetical protein